MFKNISISVFCLLILVFAANAQKISEMPTISVTGTAEIYVVPDEAIFSIVVDKINKDIQIAKSENDKSVSQVLALTKRFGIEAKDVKTDYISVSKKYEYIGVSSERRQIFTGFEVSKTVIVKLRELSKFESFFSEVLKTGATNIRSVNFATSELRKYKDEARARAIIAAREKAVAITKEIGQTIGKAIDISERNVGNSAYISQNVVNEANFGGLIGGENGSSETFSAGTITIKAQIEAKFLLN